MELTLLALLQESLDVMFSEVIQAELRAHGEQAIQYLLRRDMDAARQVGEHVVHMLGQEFLDVLRQQRQRMLRLLLRSMVMSLRLRLASQQRD
jgi:predicted metalloprotease